MPRNPMKKAVAELRMVMRNSGQSYHHLASHYGLPIPKTEKGVPKHLKNELLERALKAELERPEHQLIGVGGKSFWSYHLAQRALERWIKTYKPSLLEQIALYGPDEE